MSFIWLHHSCFTISREANRTPGKEIINAWENGEDKRKVAGDFMIKRNFTFDVLLDTENKTIDDFKVEGIPTKFVIDKAGNIRYKSVGFSGNDEATVTELSMLIDMLR